MAPPGMAFKFVCLGHNGIPRWEENRPNRHGRGSRRQNGRSIHVVPSDKLLVTNITMENHNFE